MSNTFIKNLCLANRRLDMFYNHENKNYSILDSDTDNSAVITGDQAECEEFMYQQFIEYQEERIG